MEGIILASPTDLPECFDVLSQKVTAICTDCQKVEAAGIDPGDVFDATENGICDCEKCRECRAAYALHRECFTSHYLASLDTDLQYVIDKWKSLGPAIRKAVSDSCAEQKFHRPID